MNLRCHHLVLLAVGAVVAWPAVGAAEPANVALAPVDPGLASLFYQFSEAVAQGDLDRLEKLSVPEAGRLRLQWRDLLQAIHPEYRDVRALATLETVGVREPVAFVRCVLEVTGQSRRGGGTTLISRARHEAVLRHAESGWLFTQYHWDVQAPEDLLRPLLAAPPTELTRTTTQWIS